MMRSIPIPGLIALLLCWATETAAIQDLSTAQRYWRDGALPEAMVTLKSIIQARPDGVDARLLLARVHLDLRQGAAAEQALNRALGAGAPAAEVGPLMIEALLQQRAFARALDAASTGPGAADPQARAELLAMRAEAYRGLGDMEQAQLILDQALRIAPDNAAALIERARQQAALGAPERARATLDQALALAPNEADLLMAAAELAMADRRFADADRWLTDALVSTRQNWWAYYLRALTRIELGELDAARKDIDAGRKRFSQFLGFDYADAQLAARRGDYALALARVEPFLDRNPRDPGATLLAAEAALAADLPERALEYLSTHLEAVPGSRRGSLLLAQARAALGELEEAEQVLEALLSAEHPAADVSRALGSVRLLQGDVDGAVDLLRRVVETSPDDPDLRVQLAKALMQKGDSAAAVQELAAALARQPDHVSALLERVRLAAAEDDPQSGLRAADAFLAQHPDNPYALIAAAAARARVGDHGGARTALELALAIDPGFVDAGLNLARLELADGNSDAARAVYEGLLAEAPANARVILGLAQLEVATGDTDAAIRRLEDALSRTPSSLELRRNLARGYQSLGRSEDAVALLQALPLGTVADAALLQERAAAELKTGDLDAATRTYESLVQALPDQALPRYQLARVLAAAGRPATAAEALVQGFELAPEDGAAVQAIAAVLDATRDTAARSRLLERLELTGGHPALMRLFRARDLREHGDRDAAVEQLRDIEATAASDPRFVELLMREQHAAGDSLAASRTAEVWLADHPEDGTARRRLAQLLAERGDTGAAIAAYKEVLDRAPEDVVALNNLALLLLERSPREALTYAERAREGAPNAPAIADTLGLAQLAAGKTAAAVETLRGAHEAMPTNAEVALSYARALVAAGASEAARQVLLPIADRSFAGADGVQELLGSLPE